HPRGEVIGAGPALVADALARFVGFVGWVGEHAGQDGRRPLPPWRPGVRDVRQDRVGDRITPAAALPSPPAPAPPLPRPPPPPAPPLPPARGPGPPPPAGPRPPRARWAPPGLGPRPGRPPSRGRDRRSSAVGGTRGGGGVGPAPPSCRRPC